jgi:glycosyltransferase involved in cell wall biosynthesis
LSRSGLTAWQSVATGWHISESLLRLLYAFPEPLPLPRARGVQVAYAVTSLAAAGSSVDLACVPVAGQSPLTPLGIDSCLGVNMIPVSRGWPSPLHALPPFSRWHSVRLFAGRLLREIEKRPPEALYVRHLKLAAFLSKRSGLPPLFYEAHEVFADTASARRRADTAAMESAVIQNVAGIVCNSRATAVRLEALYGKPRSLLVLPNGVSRPESLPEKHWNECRRHVVYAGSFFGWKGVDDLVAAAAELDGFGMSLIGGEAAQIERLKPRLPPHGARIELVPRLPHTEVMARLAAACIAVLPNRPDPDSAFTSPIKLFEYMAAGCAIISADLPAVREVLANEDAVWFESGSPQSLAAALRQLADDPTRARALGERVREKSAAYSWQARAVRLKGFLEDAIG